MHYALYVYILLFTKFFLGQIEGYSVWIISNTNNYGICMECYIAMARSKGCSDM